MNVTILTVLLLLAINIAASLNILGIFPYPGKSHFIVQKVYLRELANRGHNVTVISFFPQQDAPSNYHDISLAGSLPVFENSIPPTERNYGLILWGGYYLSSTGTENCEVMLANKKVQDLVNGKTKFDVVVVEQFNSDCALGIAYKLGAPVVGITSHILMPYHFQRFGVPSNPAYVSFHFLEGGVKPTLRQKLERVVFDFYFRIVNWVTQIRDQRVLAKYFDDIPPLEDLAREIKFLLLYHNFVLTGSKLLPANVIEVGGYHVAKANPLEGDLKKFVDDAEHGVIFISFGSVLKSSYLSAEKIETILQVMMTLPHRFIWKWDNDTPLLDKDKLYISNWLPQVDILAHKNTKAFVSHAGMGGTTEAIHFGVPVVAMPFFGDQPSNAASIEESGLGVQIQFTDLNFDNLLNALKTVLKPEFRENVKKLSAAWHDRPLPPLETAVFWTEFAARNSNFTFRTAAADVPLYQYANLDIIAVFFLVATVILLVVYNLCSACKRKSPKSVAKTRGKKSKRD